MKARLIIAILAITVAGLLANATDAQDVRDLAKANGYKPTKRVVLAITTAAHRYHIDPVELTAIGIMETGLGKNTHERLNPDGTVDKGLFQINTKNQQTCKEYNLNNEEGSAHCAAKLLSRIKRQRTDYLGVYHSKTPKYKNIYLKRVSRILLFHTQSKGIVFDYNLTTRSKV